MMLHFLQLQPSGDMTTSFPEAKGSWFRFLQTLLHGGTEIRGVEIQGRCWLSRMLPLKVSQAPCVGHRPGC